MTERTTAVVTVEDVAREAAPLLAALLEEHERRQAEQKAEEAA